MKARSRAAWSVVLGLLSTVALPVAVVATRYSDSYDLLHAGFGIPVAVALGIGAILLARRARALDRASLGTTRWTRVARVGRLLGILGICVAASATIAVAVYEVLLAAE